MLETHVGNREVRTLYMHNSDYLSTLEWLGNEFRGVNRDLDRGTKAQYYYNIVADRWEWPNNIPN